MLLTVFVSSLACHLGPIHSYILQNACYRPANQFCITWAKFILLVGKSQRRELKTQIGENWSRLQELMCSLKTRTHLSGTYSHTVTTLNGFFYFLFGCSKLHFLCPNSDVLRDIIIFGNTDRKHGRNQKSRDGYGFPSLVFRDECAATNVSGC